MLPQAAPEPVRLKIVAAETREVVALKHLRYTNAQGAIICVGKMQRHSMPAALAEKALKMGAAADVTDVRVKNLIGSWSMLIPAPENCVSLDGTPDTGAKPPHGPPIQSGHMQFEVVDRGPPLAGTMTVRSIPDVEG
jgi:hypothetical protein